MDKYLAVWCKDVSGTSVVLRKKRFRPDQVKDGMSYRGRTHSINVDAPIFRTANTYYYLIDLDKGQKAVGAIATVVSPKLMDAIMRKEIVKQLVSGLQGAGDWKLALIIGIIMLGCGILGGIIMGQFIDFTPSAPPVVTPVG